MKKIASVYLLGLLCMAGCNNKNKVESSNLNDYVVNEGTIEEYTGEELKIVAAMTVKPENVKNILPVFQAVVEGSQQEDGCIFYNLHQDINDSTRFIMLEEWKSQAAIDFHNSTEHYKTFKLASKDLIEKSEVTIMKLVY